MSKKGKNVINAYEKIPCETSTSGARTNEQEDEVEMSFEEENTELTLQILQTTQGIFDACAKIAEKNQRKKRFAFWIVTYLMAIGIGIHCPKEYIKREKGALIKTSVLKGIYQWILLFSTNN